MQQEENQESPFFSVVAKTRPGPEVAKTRPRPNFFWHKKKD
jgi:hypothetical protein